MQAKPPSFRKAPTLTCVIATTARTGSYFLSDLMKNTGRLGLPKEFFNPHIDKDHLTAGMSKPAPLDADSVTERCALVDANGTTPNGVAAFKVFPSHFQWLLNGIGLSAWFPNIRWLHLAREDKVGQAISWAIARQTRTWWGKRESSAPAPIYSAVEIETMLLQILADEADWSAYFLRNQIVPHRISYETLEREPAATVAAIAAFLGVQLDQPADTRTTRVKQRAALEEEWRARFFRDAGSLDRLDPPFLLRYAPRTPGTLRKFLQGKLVMGHVSERFRDE